MPNARQKQVYFIRNPQIIPASTIWPDRPDCQDPAMFVARGNQVDEDGQEYSNPTRTSLIVSIDLSKGHIETLNSIYLIV